MSSMHVWVGTQKIFGLKDYLRSGSFPVPTQAAQDERLASQCGPDPDLPGPGLGSRT